MFESCRRAAAEPRAELTAGFDECAEDMTLFLGGVVRCQALGTLCADIRKADQRSQLWRKGEVTGAE